MPPAVLVKLVREHLAARALLALADLRRAFLDELRESLGRLDPAPVNVTLFGSFAPGDDDAHSDVDVIVVRPDSIDDDDSSWSESLAGWEATVRCISGNAVNRIEVAENELPKLHEVSPAAVAGDSSRGTSSCRASLSLTLEFRRGLANS